MVYDADSGKFKRMWGAYGNKPLDMDQRPPVEPSKPNELCPMVCGIWSTYQQFSLPHDIKFSNDGLGVCGRPREQAGPSVHAEGKFVAEQFIGVDSKYPLQARSVAFLA